VPSFARALTLAIVGWVALLSLIMLAAMLWQGIASTHEADRQKIITALDHAMAEVRELMLAVEMTADSTERIVRTVRPASAARLRTVLEMALAAFEQRPELSHLGVILPDTGEYGNLERSADDGGILLWLYPGGRNEHAVTRSFRLTDTGFVPQASHPGKGYDLRRYKGRKTAYGCLPTLGLCMATSTALCGDLATPKPCTTMRGI